MADVQAFRAYRYDLARVGNLSDVIAPPYDVIDAALQDRLYERSPYNVVRLILNRETPQDSDRDNRYTRAGPARCRGRPDAAIAGDRSPRRRQPAVAGDGPAGRQRGERTARRQAGLHRGRASSLRDGAALSRGPARGGRGHGTGSSRELR